jgi:uncharacterized protein YkwD
MDTLRQARGAALACLLAVALPLALTACGMGGSGGGKQDTAASTPPASTLQQETGAPTSTNNIPTDGLNWINFRRGQVGLAQLSHSTLIDKAAQGHSDYQKTNNTVTHDQTAGKPGFTGVGLADRLAAANYALTPNTGYAIGEVISATNNSSGFYMSEELITAIYHRFVIFEPRFKEIGTGAATTTAGYTYFTSDFGAINGLGAGLGRGVLVTWPYNNQTGVTTNFFSDYESPDPVPNQNEVGYPVSVHVDINTALLVTSFTIRPRGGADLPVRLLSQANDAETKKAADAAAIIPLAVLKAATTYDVTFIGSADGVAVSKSWAFTTK